MARTKMQSVSEAVLEKARRRNGRRLSLKAQASRFLTAEDARERAELIIARLDYGDPMQSIAKDLGVNVRTVYKALFAHCPDGWKDSQAAKAMAEYERCKLELKKIRETKGKRDPVHLACAREEMRAAQWELERLIPKLFGQTNHLIVEQHTDLGDKLRRSRERTIDGEAERVDASQTPVVCHTPDESKT